MKAAMFKMLATTVALMGVVSSAHAAGDPMLWVSDASGQLATVDVTTGATTVVGNPGLMYDIAFSPSGQLYGIGTDNNLYSINSATGASTLIGGSGTGTDTVNALVFGRDGTLYAASTALYKVDTGTGAETMVGTGFSDGTVSAGDLAFVGNQLYLSTSSNDLQRIDTTTGANTDVGAIGYDAVYGLASPNGSDLYGFANQQVLSIDPTTGAGTVLSTVNGAPLDTVWGSAFFGEAVTPPPVAAVPEPETYALMMAGLGVVAFLARRRRPVID